MRPPWSESCCMAITISSCAVQDRDVALALVRHWSLIEIGATTPPPLGQWSIVSREFRENLTWAVVVPGEREISPAVTSLLEELSQRGITIHHAR